MRLAGEEPDFAQELALAVRGDRHLVVLTDVLDDLRPARERDHQVAGLAAIAEEHVTGCHRLFDAIPAENFQLNF